MVGIANAIAPSLWPKYYVNVETRTYLDEDDKELLVGIPDTLVLSSANLPIANLWSPAANTAVLTTPEKVRLPMPIAIRERYLEVRAVGSNAVITALEVLSLANKRLGKGRMVYEKKRQQMLSSLFHLI